MHPVNKTPNSSPSESPKNLGPKILGTLFAFTIAGFAGFLGRGKGFSYSRINPLSSWSRKLKVPSFSHLLSYVKPPNSSGGGSKINEKTIKAFGLAAISLPALTFYKPEKEPLKRPAQEPLLPDIPKNHPIRKEVTARIVGHEADFLIRGTSLEGSVFKDNAKHIHTFSKLCAEKEGISSKTAEKLDVFFSKLQTTEKLDVFFSNLQYVSVKKTQDVSVKKTQETKNLGQSIADKVFSLNSGESFHMQGGWTELLSDGSYEGHALLYKFTKKKDGLYDVYIYNTGAGTEKYHDKLEVEEGTRKSTLICPHVKFQGVSPSQLGFSKSEAYPEFFERLIDINQRDRPTKKQNSSIIYESREGFGGLHDKLAISGPGTSYIKPQRAGTCAFSVLLAAIRPLFESEAEFKRFKFELKYTDFLLLFEDVKDSLEVDTENQELLENQGRKLIDSLEKRLDLYSKEEITIKEARINTVLGHLASLPKVKPVIPEKIEPVFDRSLIRSKSHYFGPIYENPQKPHKITAFSTSDKKFLITKVTSENLLECLQELNGPNCKNTNVNIYVREQLGKALLDFSKEDFIAIPKEKIGPLVKELNISLQRYIESSNARETQEYINTTWAYLSAAYTLTSIRIPSLKKYGLAYSQLIRSDRYCSCYSKQGQENLVRNITFFKNQPSQARLFDFTNIERVDNDSPYPSEVSFLYNLICPGSRVYLNPEEAVALLTGQEFIQQKFKRLDEEGQFYLKKIPLMESARELQKKLEESKEGGLVRDLQEMVFLAQVSCSFPRSKIYNYHDPVIVRGYKATGITISYGEKDRFSRSYDWSPIEWGAAGIGYFPRMEYLLPDSENVILTAEKGPYDPKHDYVPRITTNQKSLQSSKLLYFFSENLMKLKKSDTDSIFFRLLFQPDKDLQKDPPIFEAIKDPAFVKQLSNFIEDGLSFFSSGFFSSKPDIVTSLFFIRLARRVKEIDPTLPLENFQDRINGYLKIPELTHKETKLIHLHRILQYKGRDSQGLTKQELQEIFSSWIFCAKSSFYDQGDGSNQKEEAFRYILSLTPILETLSSSDYDAILCSTLGKTQEEINQASVNKDWIPVAFSTYQKGPWCINVLTGELTENNKLLEFESAKYLPNLEAHRNVFRDADFPQVKQDHTYSFTDEKTGLRFRHVYEGRKEDYYSEEGVLQIQVNGDWYEHKTEDFGDWKQDEISFFSRVFNVLTNDIFTVSDSKDWGKSQIPDFLRTYHLFTNDFSAIFLDKESRTVAFTIKKHGDLLNEKENTQVAYKSDVQMREADLFEPANLRLHEITETQKRRIRFPRFRTSSGRELRLIEKEKNLFVLEENQKFVLIKPIQGILGVLENILCFKHQDTGELKVIIPIHKACPSVSLAPIRNLSLENENPFIKIHTYAEYSYSKGRIIPKDIESKLFQSYLFLIQKKEKEALALLESVGAERSFTPKMQEILTWMKDAPHKTPSGIAVALRAGMILSRAKSNESIDLLFEDYRDRYTSIPAHLRLSRLELEEAYNLCPNIKLPKSLGVTKTPVSSSYRSLVRSIEATHNPDMYNSFLDRESYKVFKDLYNKLVAAPTLEEKNLILTRISLEEFSEFDENKQAHLLLVGSYLPGLIKDPLEWVSPAYLIPPSTKAVDTDPPLPKGTPLRSLQSVLDEVSVPNYTHSPLSVREPSPVLDLQTDFVEPFFKEVKPITKVRTKPLSLPDLSGSLYKKSLTRAIREANEEIELGSKINEEEFSFSFRRDVSVKEVRETLTQSLTNLETFLVKSKQDILLMARQLPNDPLLVQKTLRLEVGGYKKVPEFEEIITHYLKGTYEDLNPHLTKKQLEELDSRVQEFLIQATKAQQLERALGQTDPHLIATTLNSKMAYTPSKNKEERVFLVYEYRSDLRIRDLQEKAIRAMLGDQDLVLQMMMGGGKTTVLTSIFLQMVEPGKIPIYIPPDAQYDTQVNNLMSMQHKHFTKHIIPMRFSREELTREKLEWLIKKFEEAAKQGKAIVSTKNTLSSLQLEFYDLLHKLPSALSSEEKNKIPLLRKILIDLKERGVVLLDEVDDLLDPFKQLNFPTGEKKSLDPHYIDFIKDVFTLHLSPEIEQPLGLTRGEQSLFSKKQYKEQVVTRIGERLFEKYKDVFCLKDHFKKACIEYMVEGKENLSFLSFLEEKLRSQNPEEVRSAQLIYLAKGLLHDLLPSIMEKQENRNYGLPDGAKDRKAVPFEGAKSPSHTEFAGPYEAACYQDLIALSGVLSGEHLQKIASSFLEKVIPLLQYTKKKLADTEEGKKFFRLTGVLLERFQNNDKEALEEALSYLKNHPENRLEIEKIFIEEFVGAYESYFQSNSQNFLNLFSRKVGITGTPKNPMVFPKSMPIYAEKGTLGRIRSTYLNRADAESSSIHISKTNKIEEVLASSLQNNPRKNRFRALLDPTGLFKDENNLSIAEGILTYFEQDSTIQSVLFYGRVQGNMGVPGTLMVLKKPRKSDGTFSCEKIEGTGVEALKAKEINPNSTITFYDERHCEATDIPQIPEALGLVTVNNRLGDRDFLQTDLRLRGYLGCQDVDIVMLEKERENYGESLTGRNVLTQMEVAQEVKNTDEASIIFRQKMDNIVRQRANEDLLANPSHEVMKKIQDALLTKQDLSPKAFFGGVSRLEDPLKLFDLHRKELEKKFPSLIDARVRKSFDSLRLELVENIDHFPALVPTLENAVQGMQMEVSMRQEVKQEVTVDASISLELQREYQSYQGFYTGYPFKEIPWNAADMEIAEGDRTRNKPKIMKTSDLLERILYEKDYYELFTNSDLLVTENFVYTKTWLLPIFSKRQKPAEQILITEDAGEFKALLLSEEEAFFFKEKIKGGLENTWLYLPNGEMHIASTGKATPRNTRKIQKALFDANLINGNAGYLLLHKEETLSRVKHSPKLKDLLLRFLAVKAQGNPSQQGALDRLTLELNQGVK